jgi:hypothetical protein
MGKGWISDYNSEPEKFGFAYYCTDKKIRWNNYSRTMLQSFCEIILPPNPSNLLTNNSPFLIEVKLQSLIRKYLSPFKASRRYLTNNFDYQYLIRYQNAKMKWRMLAIRSDCCFLNSRLRDS